MEFYSTHYSRRLAWVVPALLTLACAVPAAAVPEAGTAVSLGFLLLLGGVSLCCVKRRAAGRE